MSVEAAPGGSYVAFQSVASNLVPDDTNGASDVFLRDRQTETTKRVSVGAAGAEADAASLAPSISSDGRYIAFESSASNLVSGDTNSRSDIFVHDQQTGMTERVSVDASGAELDATSHRPAISSGGRYVVFESASAVPNGRVAIEALHDRLSRQGLTHVQIAEGLAQRLGTVKNRPRLALDKIRAA